MLPIHNSNQVASRLTSTTSFPRVFSRLLQYLTQSTSFLAHRAALMTNFSNILFKICRFRSSILAAFAVSFHSTRRDARAVRAWLDSGVIFLDLLINRFHVAVRLFSNRSQMTSKCGKKKKSGTRGVAECVNDVLTAFCRLL